MTDRPWAGRRLHFVGIGGAGMSGLALVAHALGAEVSGSDRVESPYMEPLRAEGIEPAIGHDAANVPAGAEVVVSTAIAGDNPEVGDDPTHRGRLLAEVSRLRRCVAVAGTHGKTTTACMVAHVLLETGGAPSYLIGGELRTTGRNADWGDGDWVVVEADESDRSFLELAPDLAVVTNVELDHHSTYRTEREIEAAFEAFAAAASTIVAWSGVPGRVLAQPRGLEHGSRTLLYGIERGDVAATGVRLEAGGSRFRALGADVELRVPGEHNVLNALGALAACREAGVEPTAAAAALATFTGAARRFELVGTTPSGAAVFDDYAHHPTEVRETLQAARTFEPRRLVACFQPHLYSRTERLAREFGRALALADAACVLDVYPARERAEDHPGVSGFAVAAATADASGGRRVYWTPTKADAERLLGSLLGEGDLLLTLGAGDVDRVARALVA
jgi:UDP-N-acetylmuramate--alanine ligase